LNIFLVIKRQLLNLNSFIRTSIHKDTIPYLERFHKMTIDSELKKYALNAIKNIKERDDL